MSTPPEHAKREPERRTNLELRALINEMLERVRDLHRNTQVWEPTERARAEADLEMIMARIRRAAARVPVDETNTVR